MSLTDDNIFHKDIYTCTDPDQSTGAIGYCYWKQSCNDTVNSFGGVYLNFTLQDYVESSGNNTMNKVISLKLKHLVVKINEINSTETNDYCGLALVG